MNILLLHPDDSLPRKPSAGGWDLVVDLGRASASTYAEWSREAACPVISVYDFADEADDLHCVSQLLQSGMGKLQDDVGIDWWNVLCVFFASQMQQLVLIRRMAKELGAQCELECTRSDFRVKALQSLVDGRLVDLESTLGAVARRSRHYQRVAANFSIRQILQIAQDKFDARHALRRRFAKRPQIAKGTRVLLPSAYINVSRMALSFAQMMPEDQFLLVCVRESARVKEVPPNVQMISLDSYFSNPDPAEVSYLQNAWVELERDLSRDSSEFRSAGLAGLLNGMPSLIEWGITVRDAWRRLFESQDFCSCLSTDQDNPYSGIPLLLAKRDGIPAVACHHGSLDVFMALTSHEADFYIAKSEMERDYMERVCDMDRKKILPVGPMRSRSATLDVPKLSDRPWLVFFSEPYDASGWRVDEVYRELLPALCALAETCGLKLVFKLHPFESEKAHRKLLLRHLPAQNASQVEIMSGPISAQIWQNTRFALTAQSSVALECVERNIPVFLCGWLGDSFSGYLRQYQRFGVGHVLETATQICDIPQLLHSKPPTAGRKSTESHPNHTNSNDVAILREVLVPTRALPTAAAV